MKRTLSRRGFIAVSAAVVLGAAVMGTADRTVFATGSSPVAEGGNGIFSVYHSATDANPSAQLGDAQLLFGQGGANPLDVTLSYQTNANQAGVTLQTRADSKATVLNLIPTSGTYPTAGSPVTTIHVNMLADGSEYVTLHAEAGTLYGIQVHASGAGVTYPFVFLMSNAAIEAFRVTTEPLFQLSVGMTAAADNSVPIGTATNRFSSISSVLHNVYGASADANPSAQLLDKGLLLGIGGSNALDFKFYHAGIAATAIMQTLANGSATAFLIRQTAGTAVNAGQTTAFFKMYGNSGTNLDETIKLDAIRQTSFIFNVAAGSSATVRPLIFQMGGAPVITLTATPNLQLNAVPAFVAGDHYVVMDASGNVHVSATGPAS